MTEHKTARVRALNDQFRTTLAGGKVYTTSGVSSRGPGFVTMALATVQTFNQFTEDNDPYGEHDFGSFTLQSEKLFWKIDYYDKRDPDLGAEDPSDPTTTERVLTIMLAEEY